MGFHRTRSYSLVGAILFFIGFMESVPALRLGVWRRRLSNACMGFGFFWVMQIHMSWVMLAPFGAYALYAQWKEGAWKAALGYGTLGALPLLATLLPTYWVYGFATARNIHGYSAFFNRFNMQQFLAVLARFLSLACFELPRFLGEHTPDRIAFLTQAPWLLVPGFFLWAAGILQALMLCGFLFFSLPGKADWKPVKTLTLALFLVIYFFFWFSIKPPSVHRYYEALPVAMIYSFYCWERLAVWKFWRWAGVLFLAAGIYFQVGYAAQSHRSGVSVYSQYRPRMARALAAKNYRLLAERRPYALY
jgi:hypothetical protein